MSVTSKAHSRTPTSSSAFANSDVESRIDWNAEKDALASVRSQRDDDGIDDFRQPVRWSGNAALTQDMGGSNDMEQRRGAANDPAKISMKTPVTLKHQPAERVEAAFSFPSKERPTTSEMDNIILSKAHGFTTTSYSTVNNTERTNDGISAERTHQLNSVPPHVNSPAVVLRPKQQSTNSVETHSLGVKENSSMNRSEIRVEAEVSTQPGESSSQIKRKVVTNVTSVTEDVFRKSATRELEAHTGIHIDPNKHHHLKSRPVTPVDRVAPNSIALNIDKQKDIPLTPTPPSIPKNSQHAHQNSSGSSPLRPSLRTALQKPHTQNSTETPFTPQSTSMMPSGPSQIGMGHTQQHSSKNHSSDAEATSNISRVKDSLRDAGKANRFDRAISNILPSKDIMRGSEEKKGGKANSTNEQYPMPVSSKMTSNDEREVSEGMRDRVQVHALHNEEPLNSPQVQGLSKDVDRQNNLSKLQTTSSHGDNQTATSGHLSKLQDRVWQNQDNNNNTNSSANSSHKDSSYGSDKRKELESYSATKPRGEESSAYQDVNKQPKSPFELQIVPTSSPKDRPKLTGKTLTQETNSSVKTPEHPSKNIEATKIRSALDPRNVQLSTTHSSATLGLLALSQGPHNTKPHLQTSITGESIPQDAKNATHSLFESRSNGPSLKLHSHVNEENESSDSAGAPWTSEKRGGVGPIHQISTSGTLQPLPFNSTVSKYDAPENVNNSLQKTSGGSVKTFQQETSGGKTMNAPLPTPLEVSSTQIKKSWDHAPNDKKNAIGIYIAQDVGTRALGDKFQSRVEESEPEEDAGVANSDYGHDHFEVMETELTEDDHLDESSLVDDEMLAEEDQHNDVVQNEPDYAEDYDSFDDYHGYEDPRHGTIPISEQDNSDFFSGRDSTAPSEAMFTHRENLLAHAASHADGFSIGEDNYVDDFFGSFHASPPLHNHENMGEGSKRPPWKPNSLILKDGFDAYQVAYSAKERALRRISYVAPFCQPSLKTELTRDFSPERPKPPWRATVGRKLHCVTTDVQHEERSLGLREIHSRYSPTRTRSLSAGRNKKRESRGSSRNRAMANQRTFSNLPKSKGVRTRSFSQEKKAESISDRIRKEMKILSESRRVQRGNWTMAGSRFVSQVKQPAWAAPFASRPLPPPEKPKRSPPIRRTRALGHGRNVLKDMLDKLQSLSKSLGTSDSSEHIQILLELSRHWVLQKDLREALRVGILAKSIVGRLIRKDEDELFQRLDTISDGLDAEGTAKSTIPKIDTVRSPFDSGSLGEVLNLEARVDHIIAHIVDARSSELREGLDLVPDFDVGDGSHIKNEDKRSDKWKHGRRYDDSSREDEDEKGSVVTAGSVAGGKYVDMQDVSAYTSSESLQ